MSKFSLWVTLIPLSLLSATASCTRNGSSRDSKHPVWQQYEQGKGCIEAKDYSGAMTLFHKLLSSVRETEMEDFVPGICRMALNNYNSACQRTRQFDRGIAFLDSLRSTDTYISRHCRHDLLANLTNLLQIAGKCSRAVELADEYLALAPAADLRAHIETLEMISGAYYYCGNDPLKAIALLEQARRAYHRGGYSRSMGRILTRLATYYRNASRYREAVETNLEAIDFYARTPGNPQVAMAYGEMSNTYKTLGMMPEALHMNDEALTYARIDSFGLADLYRFRAEIYSKSGQWDSAFHYLRHGEEVSAAMGLFKGVYLSRLLRAGVLLNFPDSLPHASTILKELCRDSAQIPAMIKQNLVCYTAQSLMLSGRPQEGIPLLKANTEAFRAMNIPEDELQSFRLLMKGYADCGMDTPLASCFPRYDILRDTVTKIENLRRAASSYIHFETRQKEERIQLLSTQLELRTRKLYYNIGLSVLLLLLLVSAIAYIFVRRRSNRLLAEANRRHMESIIARQQYLNRKNELLTQEIEKVTLANTEATLGLSTQNILSRDDENEFRQAFTRVHPHFLKSLRQTYSSLTKTEELVIMLIYLNYKNEEIALILGINKMSVNATRSHIRKKIGLEKNESLEQAVMELR